MLAVGDTAVSKQTKVPAVMFWLGETDHGQMNNCKE
jgi:hypothetical protein